MNSHRARRLRLTALIVAALSLNACAIQPYAGIYIAGPGFAYGPFRVGTGANIGIALPRVR
jgi:hypothetical protein